MVAVNIKAFRGQVPRVSDRLLQPNQATRALNCKITSGRLDPLNGLGLEQPTLVSQLRTIYRYRNVRPQGTSDHWLTWSDDVDVVLSPLANDPQGKFYFTSDAFEPRMSTYDAAVVTNPLPTAWFALGVPAPVAAPAVAVTGGVAPQESRAYAYTFVTTLGEESGPSPASALVTGNANGTWDVTGMNVAPPNAGTITAAAANTPSAGLVRVTFNTTFGVAPFETLTIAGVAGMTDLNGVRRVVAVNGNQVDFALSTSQTYTSGGTWTRRAPINTAGMTKRIYRSAGLEGNFLFVAEVPVTQTSYADTTAGAALGEVIATLNTLPAPKNLRSIISLPNGCLAGLTDNELCFSEPYLPYSWPQSNRYSFSGRGVACAPSGNSVIVLTDTFPIVFVGSDPEAMSPSVMETYAPCVAKRGVVNVGGGCVYPSFDGLWLAAPGRVENLTKRLYRAEEWSELNPASFVAAFQDGQYFGHYDSVDGLTSRMWVLDLSEADSVVEVAEFATALHRNQYDGKLYVGQGNTIYAWDANMGRTYASDWVSMTMQMAKPTNFAVAQVHARFQDVVPVDPSITLANEALIAAGADAVAGHLNGHELLAVTVNGSNLVPNTPDTLKKVQFTLFADGEPVYTKAVTSSTPFRLPAGYKSEVFNVGLAASVPIFTATIAESMAELAQASS